MPDRVNETPTALIVIDFQTGVVEKARHRDSVANKISGLVERARSSGVEVIWVQHDDDELKKGSPEWALAKELVPNENEVRIEKHYNSAFADTGLHEILRNRGISNLVICGAATNWCVRATCYAALERGYNLTLAADAHTTRDTTLEDGRPLSAASIVDDLNLTMQGIQYPSARSKTQNSNEIELGNG